MTRESRSSKNRAIFPPSWVGGVVEESHEAQIGNQQSKSKLGNQKSEITLVPPQGFEPRTNRL
jgi:hypothetical protein